MDKYVLDLVISGVAPDANQTIRAVYEMIYENDIQITPVQTGQKLELGSGIELEFLLFEERGAILWLSWKNFSALIPTGKVSLSNICLPDEPDVILIPDNLEVDEIPMGAINQWSPSVILLPFEESDLPLQGQHELLTALKDYPVVSTLDHNWVRITTDGMKMWVNGE